MERSNIVSFNRKEFVSINTNTKDQNVQHREVINLLAFELCTPITVMKSNIQFLKKNCLGNKHSCVEESFLLCEDSVDNIFRFINCISFLSDLDQGKLKLKKNSFNLQVFIDQVLEELRQSNSDVSRIQVHSAVSCQNIITDKYLLNRILINLLANALKYSSTAVELFVSEITNQLTFIVRDEGIGIPEEEINAVFHPFVRASNVKLISGTGLGLSIVLKAVDSLEGAVYVNSKKDKGSEFVVIIPFEAKNGKCSKIKKSIDLMTQF